MKSYIQVYTGNGKGKTTASIGLAVRQALAGGTVWIGQFMKGQAYAELKLPEYIKNIEIEQLGNECFIYEEPGQEDYDDAEAGLLRCKEALEADYDMVILEELNVALFYELIDIDEVIEIIKNRNPKTEVIITGRYAPEKIIDMADLVTEMKEVKHYYSQGVEAREGIEF